MDREFLRVNMSAYLDGELAPKQMREFERDIQSYPDLFAELQTLQRLNKLAFDSQVPLPDDRYFDKLADRIDAQVKRETQQDRGKVINFFLERRKAVAIVSSVAAVFLVAVIGMNMFGPSAKRYPQEIRNIELKPAIIEKSKTDTVTIWPEYEKQIVPPPVVEEEVKRDTLARKAYSGELDRTEDQAASSAPSEIIRQESAPAVPAPDTITQVVISKRSLLKLSTKEQPSHSKSQSLSEKTESPAKSAVSHENSSGVLSVPRVIDTITIRTEPIISGEADARFQTLDDTRVKSIQPDTAQFHDTTERSWETYIRAFKQMNQGMHGSWRLRAPVVSRDSLQSWVDSIQTIGPGSWYAEQAYRSLQQLDISWEDYQLWRAYIDHYLADTPDADRGLWNQRLKTINEIYERFLGKQIQK